MQALWAFRAQTSHKVAHMTKVVNILHAQYQVYIGRGSKWGNPFTHIGTEMTRADCIAEYEAWLKEQPELMAALPELKGKTLGCHCKPLSCHGDVLARLADHR